MDLARLRGWLVAALCTVLAVVALRALAQKPSARVGSSAPAPAELDSLRHYLHPVAPAPDVDDYAQYLPAAAPPVVVRESAPAAPPPPQWRVSAILITGDRHMAIIDDRQVTPGDAVAGGAQVAAVEPDRVLLRTASGAQVTLFPRAGDSRGP